AVEHGRRARDRGPIVRHVGAVGRPEHTFRPRPRDLVVPLARDLLDVHVDLEARPLVLAKTVETRVQAKYAMLGAIYGATTGASAGLMPSLAKAYPRAVALVELAARAGERGELVSTWLGRTSPPPGASWRASHDTATGEGVEADDVRNARRIARDRGRFTRNFVVQGTAAEWALCWMASLRRRLRELPGRPHLVYFLHDEVMVHSPAE